MHLYKVKRLKAQSEKFLNYDVFLAFISANCVDPDELPHDVAFHL